MKNISSELETHLASEVTTLATCWKITRVDNVVLGFTDHNRDINFDGVNFEAATGFTPSAMAASSSFSVDNLDVDGMINAGSITEADIMAGKFDFAEIEIFQVNYTDLTQGILKLRRGWLGEVTIRYNQFTAEIRGLTQKLTQNIGELYAPSCRAKLGDSRCKINMAARTYTGEVTQITSNQQFSDSGRSEAAGIFSSGTITFTSGANLGISMELKEHDAAGKFFLVLPMPYQIEIGDNYSITEGCDKTLATCQTHFDNAINFRGEPHVPGIDRMLETAGTRSEW